MKYKLKSLVEGEKIRDLLRDFSELIGMPIKIIDKEGTVVVETKKHEICFCSHKIGLVSEKCCIENITNNLNILKNKEQFEYTCPNNLSQICSPIIVDNVHIANLFIGIFFYEKPDIEAFRKQAERLGVDVDLYIEHVKLVPVISRDKVEKSKNFILKLIDIIEYMISEKLNSKESEKEAIKEKESLEQLVIERTHELFRLNCKLEEDIENHKKTEHKLKESEERYKSLVSLVPYGIIVREGRKIIFANEYCKNFFDVDSENEIVGKNIDDLFYPHPSHEKEFNESLRLIDEKGEMELKEELFIKKIDGKTLAVESAVKKFPYNGKESILVVFRDISEKKRMEKLKKEVYENNLKLQQTLEYDKLRTEFFSNISHELRTPVNVICTAIQASYMFINGDTVDKKIKTYLDIMRQNSLRLIRLVNNFLDITKIDTGYFYLELVNCDIISTVENIVLSVAEYIKNIGLEIIFDTEIEEKIIACDREKIERIMLNLLSNATKFTPVGGTIFVDIKEKDNKIYILVRDTGIGIPQEKQKSVFDRFIQIDKSLSRGQEGTGIGLSLVKALVEMHNGEIYINKEYVNGSEFIVEIPAVITEEKKGKEVTIPNMQTKVDKIKVEFSDIYM